MNRSESISKLAPALLKAQREMGNAIKDSKNPFFKSKYADLNAVREACLPALNANGISVLQPTVTIDGREYIETTFIHESGEFIAGLTKIVVAKENDPQGQGSGISYARRYGLQSMANVGAEDDDGERAQGRAAQGNAKSAAPAQQAAPAAAPVAQPAPAAPAAKQTVSSFRRGAAAAPAAKAAPQPAPAEVPASADGEAAAWE